MALGEYRNFRAGLRDFGGVSGTGEDARRDSIDEGAEYKPTSTCTGTRTAIPIDVTAFAILSVLLFVDPLAVDREYVASRVKPMKLLATTAICGCSSRWL